MTTNTVTSENLNYLKCHINNFVQYFNSIETMFLQIEKAMAHFNYETEEIETEVFSYIKSWQLEKLN